MNHPEAEPKIPWPETKLGRWSGTALDAHPPKHIPDGEVSHWEEEAYVPVAALKRMRNAFSNEINRCLKTRGIASPETELRTEHELLAFSRAQDLLKAELNNWGSDEVNHVS